MSNSAVEGLAKLGLDLGSLKAVSVEETTESISGVVSDSFVNWFCEDFANVYGRSAKLLTKTPMAMPIQGTVGNVHHAYMNIPAGNNAAAKHALYRRASGPLVL